MDVPTTDREVRASVTGILGGISISRLRVYDGRSPDGLAGGSPHMHLACQEAYYVLAGEGVVETLDLTDGYRRTEVRAGDALHFDPGVVHRLVNESALEILVLMQNSGLPEHGDAVFTFPPGDLSDAATYARFASIQVVDDAMARRDRAVRGFMLLRDGFERSPEVGRALLEAFHGRAAALVEHAIPRWCEIVAAGPAAAVDRTLARLAALVDGRPIDFGDGQVVALERAPERLGMCGRLNPLLLEEGWSAGVLP
jgi:mannose-6-phosphate isomerase-like protein (cupin superfamily)